MKISLIVAVDQNNGIGKNNDLPWNLPADLQFFKETTTGHIVVMGRKNYESIPDRFRPLPNRENAVLTRNKFYQAKDCFIFNDIKSCLTHYQKETDRTVFMIGGGELFKQILEMNVLSEMYITHIDHTFDCDVFFPEINVSDWNVTILKTQCVDEKNKYSFTIKKYVFN